MPSMPKNRMSALMFVLAAMVLALAAACLLSGSVVGSTPAASKKVTLKVWLTLDIYQMKRLQELLPEFTKIHPTIDVDVSLVGWGEYWTKITTAFAGGAAPDVIMTGSAFVWQVVNRGLGRSIEHLARNWDELGDFAPSALETCSYDDKLYGIPLMAPARTLWYRKDIFEEVGLDPTRPPETWGAVRDVARKLIRVEGNRITRLGLWPPNDFYIYIFLTEDVKWFSKDIRRAAFNTPQGLRAWEFAVELVRELVPEGWALSVKSFEAGGLGMLWGYPPSYQIIAQSDPRVLEEIGGPVVVGSKVKACYTFCDWVYITTQSKYPNEAWEFIKWLANGWTLAEILSQGVSVLPPPRRSAFEHPYYSGPQGLLPKRMFAQATWPYGRRFELWPDYFLLAKIAQESFERVKKGELPPREGLAYMETRFNQVLEDIWKGIGKK